MLDEATMRATAIHDGAERRLNLLTSRHTETMRRLTEIRDVVTNLVASETARGSLEEEVAKSVASSVAASGTSASTQPAAAAQAARASAGDGGRRAPVGPQLPGRGGRDAAPAEAPRSTPARAGAQHTDDGTDELPARATPAAAEERATKAATPTTRATPATGGAQASGTRTNTQPD